MRRLLAITLGDPAGIGPETIVGAWQRPELHACCRALVVGHPEILRRAARLLTSDVEVVEIASPEEAEPTPQAIPCLRAGSDDILDAPPGQIDARCGQAAYEAVVSAARLAVAGRVDGMVTAPLSKAALWAAGHKYPGHTELLAELCGVSDFAMMLYLGANGWHAPEHGWEGRGFGWHAPEHGREGRGIGVVHVTLHMALRDVFAHLSIDAVLAKCHLADTVMRSMQVASPRIGVCALNPHAGEQGLFGDEERRIIAPAVEAARKAGLSVTGPLAADTLMVRARDGEFDAVVAMYHDQGHIALKLLGMQRAVNITLGLPIVRTSVAHGTAFDIAWRGRADCQSMVEAARVAARLAGERGASAP
jgi:4-hydroxythreonine-4-phosphate dehydrogenase